MANTSLKSHPTSTGLFPVLPNRPLRPSVCILHPTLREKSAQSGTKNDVQLTRDELRELKTMISDYGYEAQSWLRSKTVLNQKRRRWLEALFYEAGLDGAYCHTARVSGPNGEWDVALHNVWHKVIT